MKKKVGENEAIFGSVTAQELVDAIRMQVGPRAQRLGRLLGWAVCAGGDVPRARLPTGAVRRSRFEGTPSMRPQRAGCVCGNGEPKRAASCSSCSPRGLGVAALAALLQRGTERWPPLPALCLWPTIVRARAATREPVGRHTSLCIISLTDGLGPS